jgi:hypothetical protein
VKAPPTSTPMRARPFDFLLPDVIARAAPARGEVMGGTACSLRKALSATGNQQWRLSIPLLWTSEKRKKF